LVRWLRLADKRGRAGIVNWMPKDKDMRLVPLPRPGANILAKLQMTANEGQLYVFVNSKGPRQGQRIKRQNTWRDFQVIRHRAGVPPCSMKDLRKSYCTNLSAKIPIHVVQELAGHSDIRTTRRYYLKVQPELMDAARQAVGAFLES